MPKFRIRRSGRKSKDAKQDRQIKEVRKLVGVPQCYFWQTNLSGGLVPVAPSWATGPLLVQGTAQSTRLGDQVRIIGFEYRGSFHNQATAGEEEIVRFMVVLDHQTEAVTPTFGEIITDSTTAIRSIYSPFQPGNVSYPGDPSPHKGKAYRIMYETTFRLSAESVADAQAIRPDGAYPNSKFIHVRKRCNIVVRYRGNAGTIADLIQNSLSYGSWSQAGANVRESSAWTIYYQNIV